ncbi:MAG: ISL3 family transposase [Lachnospiraceae bacterium]|nr:ISL3 family transposase [Lachnospiraceae bacterium]
MYNHCIIKLINIEDVIVKKIIHSDSSVRIMLETKPKEHIYPVCGRNTKRIHDYRMQTIKDLPFQLKHCYLILRKRRYVCSCGKRFYENYSFLPKYFQRTSRMTAFIADALHDTRSVTSVAKMCNVSTATVNRILDTISYGRPDIPLAISIDEFKGNAGGQKYQCILVDPIKHSVLDILPSRSQTQLVSYFRSIPKKERYRVKFFVCDMWRPYTDLAQSFFPNATVVIDKYHFIRQVTWAIENVRKRIQKTMPGYLRKYYKRSRSLILTRYDKLKDEKKQECDLMLLYNDDLRLAHYLKEWFYRICQNPRYSEQRKELLKWISTAEQSQLPEFERCAATYRHWCKEILNAFKYSHISNGPTEGFNNKIKVLKRTSYGIRNFDHFRTRILLNMH